MFTKRFFILCLLMMQALSISLFAANTSQQDGKLNIPLHPVPTGGTHPRCPPLVPIQCFYMDGSLTFTYTIDLGTLCCEVVRQSDQKVFEATFSACAEDADSLYVSENAGDYIIMLTTADSTQFTGEYVLYPEDSGNSDVGYAVQFGNSLSGGYVACYGGSVMVKGAVVAPSLMVPSDPEKMSDIYDLDSKRGIQGIMELAPVEYTVKQEETVSPYFGLLADEVQKVYPELVREDALGNKQVDYVGLIPLLIQSVQQLSSEVGVLQQTLENVRANIPGYNVAGLEDNLYSGQEACVSVDGRCEIAYSLPETAQEAMLYIYSISGKMVGSYTLEGRGNGKLVVDTSRFGKGSYIYTLIADGRSVASHQMIVQ